MKKKNKKPNDFDRSVQSYFNDIGKLTPLSREEEYDLWKRYKYNNDINARNKLVSSNLKFVANIAKGYQGMGLSYSDLIAEGNIGLIKAIDRFNGDMGNKVISYSVWWIRQTIQEALDRRGMVDADDIPCDFEPQKLDDDYTSEYDSSDQSFADEDNIANNIDISDMVDSLTDILNERELTIISKYYGINGAKVMTLEEIGSELGLTKERVRQLNERSLKKLRAEAIANLNESSINSIC